LIKAAIFLKGKSKLEINSGRIEMLSNSDRNTFTFSVFYTRDIYHDPKTVEGTGGIKTKPPSSFF
jgi:hypothetical protein